MLTITVNGNEEKLNIGCRTFVTVEQLLQQLYVKPLEQQVVTLNGSCVKQSEFERTGVKNGDTLQLTTI